MDNAKTSAPSAASCAECGAGLGEPVNAGTDKLVIPIVNDAVYSPVFRDQIVGPYETEKVLDHYELLCKPCGYKRGPVFS